MIVSDNQENEAIRFHRPFKIFSQEIQVLYPSGKLIGTVEEEFSFCRASFKILDQTEKLYCESWDQLAFYTDNLILKYRMWNYYETF